MRMGKAKKREGRSRSRARTPSRKPSRRLRAIDLYSGIGGWTLGLKMAGIEVVHSYEWWPKANRTHHHNFGTDHEECDIRKLDLKDLPKSIDIVVGSPPCTQFSYANRGGNGDIPDGLVDIEAFLKVVAHLRPKSWVMENVPRVAEILRREIGIGGSLFKYRSLFKSIEVFDLSEFGVPQARRRMIAGDYPVEVLLKSKGKMPTVTLGAVLKALNGSPPTVTDPVYGFSIPREKVTELEHEQALTSEEHRLNRDSKRYHPVYNKMSFPDRLDRPARTVTATCTRVSRESIVVPIEGSGVQVRRLSLRESACLQGFPVTYQFYGDSHTEKQRLIGNALPPPMAMQVASAMRIRLSRQTRMPKLSYRHPLPDVPPPQTHPERNGGRYRWERSFRAALLNLRFGSGVRIDLSNDFAGGQEVSWSCNFYYGSSKQVSRIEPSEKVSDSLLSQLEKRGIALPITPLRSAVAKVLGEAPDGVTLQKLWVHQLPYDGRMGPFEFSDRIGEAVAAATDLLGLDAIEEMAGIIKRRTGLGKTSHECALIFLGLIASEWVNRHFRGDPQAQPACACPASAAERVPG